MITYPKIDTYIIFYSQGTCGAFISSLIYEFLINPRNVIPIGKKGDAHERAKYYISNWRIQRSDNDKVFPTFKNITPLNPNVPLIIQQHELPTNCDYEFLFKKFPKCKLIFITYTEQDIPIIKKNIDKKINSVEILKKYKTDIDLNYLNLEIDKNNKHYIFKFNEIISNPLKTLQMLSQITQKPVNSTVALNYKDYLKKQNFYAIS